MYFKHSSSCKGTFFFFFFLFSKNVYSMNIYLIRNTQNNVAVISDDPSSHHPLPTIVVERYGIYQIVILIINCQTNSIQNPNLMLNFAWNLQCKRFVKSPFTKHPKSSELVQELNIKHSVQNMQVQVFVVE